MEKFEKHGKHADTDEPELTIKLGSITMEGLPGPEQIERMKSELPPEALRINDYMVDALVKNPHKIVEGLGIALQFAAEELAELTGKSREEVGANLFAQVGASILKTEDEGATALFALAFIEAIVTYWRTEADKQEARNKDRQKHE